MLNRRHIRIKVMQAIYAMHQSGSDDLEKQEKFLQASLENILDLYLIMLSSLVEIRKKEIEYIEIAQKKHLATPEERNPNQRFVNNPILVALEESNSLSIALEKRKINNWQANDDTILLLLQDVKQSDLYQNYMAKKAVTFEEERFFVVDMFWIRVIMGSFYRTHMQTFFRFNMQMPHQILGLFVIFLRMNKSDLFGWIRRFLKRMRSPKFVKISRCPQGVCHSSLVVKKF